MTGPEFRALALALPGAVEGAHQDHPDFRMNSRVFATLGYPDDGYGMVRLTPDQQRALLREEPSVFRACAGAWGRAGATQVHLAAARRSLVAAALKTAWRNLAEPAPTSAASLHSSHADV